MDYILQNIGLNKVNIQVNTNLYEETNGYIEEENLFGGIENIIDIYQSNNKKPQHRNNSETTHNAIKRPIVNNIINNFNKSVDVSDNITGFNSLILCVLEIIDPLVSVLNNSTKLEKIKNFKNMMDLNLGMIKLQISKDEMKKAIDNEDIIVCIYFAFILKKNIVLYKDDDIEIYGNYDECIVISFDPIEKVYKISDINTKDNVDFYKRLMIDKRLKMMIENNFIEKLNTFLLKDLKDTADKLHIPTYKIEENKKKNLLKNELKDKIKQKIEEYKQ